MKLKIFEPHIKLEKLSFTLTSATPFIICNYMLYFFNVSSILINLLSADQTGPFHKF